MWRKLFQCIIEFRRDARVRRTIGKLAEFADDFDLDAADQQKVYGAIFCPDQSRPAPGANSHAIKPFAPGQQNNRTIDRCRKNILLCDREVACHFSEQYAAGLFDAIKWRPACALGYRQMIRHPFFQKSVVAIFC
ncbi:hypothetical protein MnTg02_03157 [bacterium MnTg02]|nr:hypothetical protein MnTg02_03157 [bacterium MnTg02]